jgi:hypothetical protein
MGIRVTNRVGEGNLEDLWMVRVGGVRLKCFEPYRHIGRMFLMAWIPGKFLKRADAVILAEGCD